MDVVDRLRRRMVDEHGFTIVELLTATVLAVLLMGTFGVLLITTSRNQPKIAERSSQVEQGRVAVEKITRDLREAYAVVGTPTSSAISVNTFVRRASCGSSTSLDPDEPAIACRVSFTCTTTSCARTEANTDGSAAGPAVLLIDGIRDPSVFTYSPSAADPAHVSVTLRFSGDDGGESITVSDGAELRND